MKPFKHTRISLLLQYKTIPEDTVWIITRKFGRKLSRRSFRLKHRATLSIHELYNVMLYAQYYYYYSQYIGKDQELYAESNSRICLLLLWKSAKHLARIQIKISSGSISSIWIRVKASIVTYITFVFVLHLLHNIIDSYMSSFTVNNNCTSFPFHLIHLRIVLWNHVLIYLSALYSRMGTINFPIHALLLREFILTCFFDMWPS